MDEQTPLLAAEIEAVKETYAAINRNDIPAAVKAFDPQMEWIEPPHYPGAGTHRGHAEVIANISKGRNTRAEGSWAKPACGRPSDGRIRPRVRGKPLRCCARPDQ